MTKTEIELKSEIEKLKLINIKMRNCLNCNYYSLIKPIWESLTYDESEEPFPCCDCENCSKWELAE